ncbi:transporter substrate-binding domain-containing protein [Candidatus Albibeggiatoa sp. nov. NOAA]|uniref:substrate-binding periplasmic protein n=1 Tax=Candidatus Albibeggiatoa sp. nov. NOAA TaxID=3162724 RepID=UPI0032FCFCDF|nr:transporter substrate-binding domain-containing protein [Thiotrichaceae bacterium]
MTVAITNSVPWSQYDEKQTIDTRQPSGFNIDLWQNMAEDLRLCSQWQYNQDMKQVILSVNTNKADVGLVNFPASNVLQLGLQTATVKDYTTSHIVKKVLSDLTSSLSWKILWIVILALLVSSFIRWVVDRFQPQDFRRFTRSFIRDLPGVTWWNVNLIIGWEGVDTSRGLALFFDLVWHILGMVLFGAMLSILTVSFSLAASGNQIHKQEDVDGKTVAVIKDSNHIKHYLKQRDPNTEFIEVDNLKQGFELLETFKIDALVHNSVQLKNFFDDHYGNGQANIRLLPKVINYQQYGIIIDPNNAYKEAIVDLLAKYNKAQGLDISLIESLSNKWGITLETESFGDI